MVVGGGEHARVVIEAARSRPELWSVEGFVDPQPCTETAELLRVRRLGDDEEAFRIARGSPDACFILGVGPLGPSPARAEIVARYAAHAARWATVVHAHAWLSPTAMLGPGAVVFAGAVLNAGARVGDHGVVNTGAIVEHDVRLGPFAMVGPGAAIGGGAVVGERSYLGLGCRVRDHVTIGRDVMVGMGAVVVGSVPDGQCVMGVPARATTWGSGDA